MVHIYRHMRSVVAVATMRALIQMQRERLDQLIERLERCKP